MYVLNNPIRYNDPTGHNVDCGIGDSGCNDAKREYHYSWHKNHKSDFKTFIRAKDAFYFYNKHPDIALKDSLAPAKTVKTWEEASSYELAGIYAEDVKHTFFIPITDEIALREIDRARASGEPVTPLVMALMFGLGVKEWMSQDEGGGGGIRNPVLQTGGHTLNKDTLEALELSPDQGKTAIEGMKKFLGKRNDFHSTKIYSNGDVYDANSNELLGNLYDFLP